VCSTDEQTEEPSSPPRPPNANGAWPGREEDEETEGALSDSKRGSLFGSRRPTATDGSEGTHSAYSGSYATGGKSDDVTLLDLLRLLHQRRDDPAAQELVALRVPHAASHVMQVGLGFCKIVGSVPGFAHFFFGFAPGNAQCCLQTGCASGILGSLLKSL
jgi:hypothetical protein